MTDQVFINCQNIFRTVFHRKGQGIVYILLLDRVPAPGKLGKLRQYLLRPLYILFFSKDFHLSISRDQCNM